MNETTEPRPVVIDASAVVEFLSVPGEVGRWVAGVIGVSRIHAPDLLGYEVLSALRRHNLTGQLSDEVAQEAIGFLLGFSAELHSVTSLAPRIWELRRSVSAYDAAYVALAELLDAPLLTLDDRLTRSPGPRCTFLAYEPA